MVAKDVITRLKQFLGLESDVDLAKALKIKPSAINNWSKRNKINYKRIFEAFPDLSPDWLLGNGNGYTFGSISLQAFQNICRQGGKPPTVLVPEKARAGYRNSFSQVVDYELPILQIQGYTDGNRYRFFEISGDSMMPTLETGDYVLCELVASLQDIKQQGIYILHTHNDILCKRIEIQDTCLLLHSNNLAYPVQEIHENDIKNYWRVISFFRNLPLS
jgi:hypothetical protein